MILFGKMKIQITPDFGVKIQCFLRAKQNTAAFVLDFLHPKNILEIFLLIYSQIKYSSESDNNCKAFWHHPWPVFQSSSKNDFQRLTQVLYFLLKRNCSRELHHFWETLHMTEFLQSSANALASFLFPAQSSSCLTLHQSHLLCMLDELCSDYNNNSRHWYWSTVLTKPNATA